MPATEKTPEQIDAEAAERERQEYWRHMRSIMYQPTAVWLVTDKLGQRWLTDQFVMLNITPSEHFRELPDGAYKLTVSKGPEARDAAVDFDINIYFEQQETRDWKRAEPTMWSVIEEYNGKAMLWDASGQPALLGEPTWLAIKRYYPEAIVEHSWRGNSIFRFTLGSEVFAYAAGIKMPPGQQGRAQAVVDVAFYEE